MIKKNNIKLQLKTSIIQIVFRQEDEELKHLNKIKMTKDK
jgi:hypothetical protein